MARCKIRRTIMTIGDSETEGMSSRFRKRCFFEGKTREAFGKQIVRTGRGYSPVNAPATKSGFSITGSGLADCEWAGRSLLRLGRAGFLWPGR